MSSFMTKLARFAQLLTLFCQHWTDAETMKLKAVSSTAGQDILPYSFVGDAATGTGITNYERLPSWPYIQFIYERRIFVIGQKTQSEDDFEAFVWLGYETLLNSSTNATSDATFGSNATACCACTEVTGSGKGCEADPLCESLICGSEYDYPECCGEFWGTECRVLASEICTPVEPNRIRCVGGSGGSLPGPGPPAGEGPVPESDATGCEDQSQQQVCGEDNGRPCQIECFEMDACRAFAFLCTPGTSCTVVCGHEGAGGGASECQDAIIDAEEASSLMIECYGHPRSCDGLRVRCPTGEDSVCQVNGVNDITVPGRLNVYTELGLHAIDIRIESHVMSPIHVFCTADASFECTTANLDTGMSCVDTNVVCDFFLVPPPPLPSSSVNATSETDMTYGCCDCDLPEPFPTCSASAACSDYVCNSYVRGDDHCCTAEGEWDLLCVGIANQICVSGGGRRRRRMLETTTTFYPPDFVEDDDENANTPVPVGDPCPETEPLCPAASANLCTSCASTCKYCAFTRGQRRRRLQLQAPPGPGLGDDICAGTDEYSCLQLYEEQVPKDIVEQHAEGGWVACCIDQYLYIVPDAGVFPECEDWYLYYFPEEIDDVERQEYCGEDLEWEDYYSITSDTNYQLACPRSQCVVCPDGFTLQLADSIDNTGYCIFTGPTPQPTPQYSSPVTAGWQNFSVDYEVTKGQPFYCRSQCHTQPQFGDIQADVVYIVHRITCAGPQSEYEEDPFPALHAFYPQSLLQTGSVHFETWNLTQYMCSSTDAPDLGDFYDAQCVTWHPSDEWLYVVIVDRIFRWNVHTHSGAWLSVRLNEYMTNMYSPRGCTIDAQRNYIWIADNDGALVAYDIGNDAVIDVNAYNFEQYPVRYYNESELDNARQRINESAYFHQYSTNVSFPKLVPLNDDFIFLSSFEEFFVLYSGPKRKSAYGDIVCKGQTYETALGSKSYHAFSTPLFNGQWLNAVNSSIIYLGGFEANSGLFNCDPFLDPETCDAYNTSTDTGRVLRSVSSYSKIAYYPWQRDLKVSFEIGPTQIAFGDSFSIRNLFEPVCDLSDYYDTDSRIQSDLHQANPFVIEARITSDTVLGIFKFMYLVNASMNETASSWQAQVCLLCGSKSLGDLSSIDFGDNVFVENECSPCLINSDGKGGIQPNVQDLSSVNDDFNIKVEVTQSTAAFSISMDDTTYNPTYLGLQLLPCPPGTGIASDSSIPDCNACPFNQFTLSEQTGACINCEGMSEGILCEGESVVLVTFNFWVASFDNREHQLKDFADINREPKLKVPNRRRLQSDDMDSNASVSDDIIVGLCPPKYCCQSVDGCDYLQQYQQYQLTGDNSAIDGLCAPGRNISVPLCGKCLDGYAETLGSTACRNDCESEWIWLVISAFTVTGIVALFVLFFDAAPPAHLVEAQGQSEMKKTMQLNRNRQQPEALEDHSTVDLPKLLKRDDLEGVQNMIFKPILYYYQSLSPILNTRGITLWLSPVLSVFSLDLSGDGGGGRGYCWSPGLTSTRKIFLSLLAPGLLIIHVVWPRLFLRNNGNGRCCVKNRRLCLGRVPYFGAAFFRVLLICVGSILSVCFKYVTTTNIGTETLLFFSPDKPAFGAWWFLGFFGVVLVVAAFGFIYYKIKRQDPVQRGETLSVYRKFVKSFHRKYWYWEFILFGRRFCIAFFTAVQFVAGHYSNIIFIVMLIAFLILQIHFKPFVYNRVNIVELLCLMLLIVAFISATYISTGHDGGVYVSTILSICIVVPFLAILYQIYHVIAYRKRVETMNDAAMTISQGPQGDREPKAPNPFEHDIERLILRAPESFKETLRRASTGRGETNVNDDDLQQIRKKAEHDDLNELELQTLNVPKKEAVVDESQTLQSGAGEDNGSVHADT